MACPGNGAYPQTWYDRIVEDTGSHYYLGTWDSSTNTNTNTNTGSALTNKQQQQPLKVKNGGKFQTVDKMALLTRK